MKRVFEFTYRTQFGKDYERSHLFFGTQKAAEERLQRFQAECVEATRKEHQDTLEWGAKHVAQYQALSDFFATLTPEQQQLFDVVNVRTDYIAESLYYAIQGYEEDKSIKEIPQRNSWYMTLVEDELVTE